ncbi:MAG: Rne/Rng family ribonuclease [Burkholderiaceae bacterium]
MPDEILINCAPHEVRVATIDQGAVQDVLVERSLNRGLVGNVYVGKVTRVLPGMQSAFVDIGLARSGFLHVADLIPVGQSQTRGEGTPLPIEHQLHEGQTLMVQVLKDPMGSKGARLTTHISLPGRLLVLLPREPHIGVSQKIPPEQREVLRTRLQSLVDSGEAESGMGLILRTNAELASDDEWLMDMRYLRATWQAVQQAATQRAAPCLLLADLTLAQRVLRDWADSDTRHIWIDSHEQLAWLQQFAQTYTPHLLDKLVLHTGERGLFEMYNAEQEIRRALQRRVDLKSGGYLVVDATEALTAIDVNTGGYVGERNFADTVFKTNLEAAHMIARQLRLRNLGGIVVVDFIDMAQDAHRDAVLDALQRQLARDRVRTAVGGFSPLGLLELTRKRTRESLAQVLTEACPACDGRGHVKTPRTVCYDILREILTESRSFSPQHFAVVAHPSVIDMFRDEESQHLANLSGFIQKAIALHAEPTFAPEHYDIVLHGSALSPAA